MVLERTMISHMSRTWTALCDLRVASHVEGNPFRLSIHDIPDVSFISFRMWDDGCVR